MGAGLDLEGWLCPALFRYFDEAPMPSRMGLAMGISSLPPDCARTSIIQLASNAYMNRNASAIVEAAVSRPWLRSIRKFLSPRSRTRRGFSSLVEREAFVVVIGE